MSACGLDGRTVLVVGAGGFLGSALVRRLADMGARVFAMSRGGRVEVPSDRVEPWAGDASEDFTARRVFDEARPDIVFHVAGSPNGRRELNAVPASLRDEVVATVNMLYHAARAAHPVQRFVMTGSLEEPQGAEAAPASPYAAAKWATGAYGRMFRLYGVDVRRVRPMMTYGPGQDAAKVVPATIGAILRGRPARIGSGTRRVDWVYVDDVVDGLVAAALAPQLECTVDLGTGEFVTVAECAREIARQLGRPELLDIRNGARGAEIERAADADAAWRLLAFRARTSLEDGLARTIAWYRKSLQREGQP